MSAQERVNIFRQKLANLGPVLGPICVVANNLVAIRIGCIELRCQRRLGR